MIHINDRFQYVNDAGEQYESVTRLCKQVVPFKSFDGVDPAVLEFAAERGKAVENVLYALLRGERASVDVPAWEQRGKTLAETVQERIPGVLAFLEDHNPEHIVDQRIVWDDEAKIAGTLDLVVLIDGEAWVLDCKCTARPEVDWPLQVGGYARMYGDHARRGVVHFKPGTGKKRCGYILREYEDALEKWEHVRNARIQSLMEYARAREAICQST